MDTDVQEQLISTIMKTFAYTKAQADYLFIQLMNCVINKDLVNRHFKNIFKYSNQPTVKTDFNLSFR